MRDDVIKGEAQLSRIYEKAADRVDEMVAEKDEALRIVARMRAVAEGLGLPEPRRSQVLDSLEYEARLFSTLRNYCAAYFYFRRWKGKSDPADLGRARAAAAAWRRDWDAYRLLVPSRRWAATLYVNDGMEAAMRNVQAGIAGN